MSITIGKDALTIQQAVDDDFLISGFIAWAGWIGRNFYGWRYQRDAGEHEAAVTAWM
jgi:hypothetical protein